MAAAALAANRAYHRNHAIQEDLKKKDAKRRAAEEKKIERWFAEFDKDRNDIFDRSELRALLTDLGSKSVDKNTKQPTPQGPPDDEALDHLMRLSAKMSGESEVPTGLTRSQICAAVNKYWNYVGEQAAWDDMFAKYDKDKTGELTFEQCKLMIHENCGKASADDIAYIIEGADANENGTISRDELLALVANWNRLVDERLAEKQKKAASIGCALL